MFVRGILQAATYKKGANMKCMLFVLGALFGLLKFELWKKKNENEPKPKQKQKSHRHFIGPCKSALFPFAGQTLHFLSWFFPL